MTYEQQTQLRFTLVTSKQIAKPTAIASASDTSLADMLGSHAPPARRWTVDGEPPVLRRTITTVMLAQLKRSPAVHSFPPNRLPPLPAPLGSFGLSATS